MDEDTTITHLLTIELAQHICRIIEKMKSVEDLVDHTSRSEHLMELEVLVVVTVQEDQLVSDLLVEALKVGVQCQQDEVRQDNLLLSIHQ